MSPIVLDIVQAMLDPLVAKELGDIQTIQINWNKTTQPYDSGFVQARTLWGESYAISIKLSRLNEFLSESWETSFPLMLREGEQIPRNQLEPLRKTTSVLDQVCQRLSRSAVARVAVESRHSSLRTSARAWLIVNKSP
jgi:hypothetical protein